eukprot:scaffold1535_cov382-Prasinococcus_capsulatus_cf.AAC.17
MRSNRESAREPPVMRTRSIRQPAWLGAARGTTACSGHLMRCAPREQLRGAFTYAAARHATPPSPSRTAAQARLRLRPYPLPSRRLARCQSVRGASNRRARRFRPRQDRQAPSRGGERAHAGSAHAALRPPLPAWKDAVHSLAPVHLKPNRSNAHAKTKPANTCTLSRRLLPPGGPGARFPSRFALPQAAAAWLHHHDVVGWCRCGRGRASGSQAGEQDSQRSPGYLAGIVQGHWDWRHTCGAGRYRYRRRCAGARRECKHRGIHARVQLCPRFIVYKGSRERRVWFCTTVGNAIHRDLHSQASAAEHIAVSLEELPRCARIASCDQGFMAVTSISTSISSLISPATTMVAAGRICGHGKNSMLNVSNHIGSRITKLLA